MPGAAFMKPMIPSASLALISGPRPAPRTEVVSEPKMVNLSDLPWTTWTSREGIGVDIRDPARRLGSSHCGFRIYRLAPGQQVTRLQAGR